MKTWLAPLRNLVRRTGWDLVRYNWFTNVNLRRQIFLQKLDIDCVLDIGANVGEYAATLRRNGYRGAILSVEPTGDAFAVLERRSRKGSKWAARRAAVAGHPGERRIFVSANSVSSSLLDQSSLMAAACPEAGYVKEEVVSAVVLDALVSEARVHGPRVWVKLDVQGSAGEILSTADFALEQIAGMEIELPLVEMYQGEGLYLDLIGHLQHRGFQLVTLESNTFDSKTGAVLEVNGTLVRTAQMNRPRIEAEAKSRE